MTLDFFTNAMQYKRLWALVIVVLCVVAGYFWGPSEHYVVYANVLGGMYAVYATNQSWTDVREAQAK